MRLKINPGDRYGHLIIIDEIESTIKSNGQTQRQFRCLCYCGKETIGKLDYLRNGNKTSCGCIRGKDGKHHQTGTRLYRIWSNMKQRCTLITHEKYHHYGGRGIEVCKEWQNFETFYEWAMSNGYSDELTIDRINNDGNYEPTNCRWVTQKAQANNKRNNVLITHNNENKTIAEWSEFANIPQSVLQWRLNKGWSGDKLLAPVRSQKPNKPFKTDNYRNEIITWFKDGITKTEIGKRLNIGRNYIHSALKRWDII